ncbi:SHOCT domain-containing protein [Aeromicrobium wangtongii]|uniref:SHOCT domain-containing protein n=1 Tax=Aeromicrobium wangtongii TaxID=2969247 RepID=UPI00201749DD|nr:SHOCT domain-containing protein [Aeromicrobium wangtongii]MCL3819161.1 SHOCT domain-containing protein [Aeromicrobium wangtongii]
MSAFGVDGWELVWSIFWVLAFFVYIFALFAIINDLFDDHGLSGWWKALWVVALLVFPFLTILVYLIARGRGMQERAQRRAAAAQQATDDYIRATAGQRSPADEIAKAKALLDDGTITQAEYDSMKARALA